MKLAQKTTSRPRPLFASAIIPLFLAFWLAACSLGAGRPTSAPKGSLGAWKAKAGEEWIEVTPERIALYKDGWLRFLKVLNRQSSTWVLRQYGLVETWELQSLPDGGLSVSEGEAPQFFQRVSPMPPSLRLSQVVLRDSKNGPPLEEARIKEVQGEFERRLAQEQKALQAGNREEALKEAAQNVEYLLGLVKAVGWIDSARFGATAAQRAAIFVQHNDDLGLMLAALPKIEADAHSSESAELLDLYGLMTDRVQLLLGEKQRFGSQLGEEKDGRPVVLALEDPCHVDQRRAALAEPPLSEYLELAAKFRYEGKKKISVPDLDQAIAQGECKASPMDSELQLGSISSRGRTRSTQYTFALGFRFTSRTRSTPQSAPSQRGQKRSGGQS